MLLALTFALASIAAASTAASDRADVLSVMTTTLPSGDDVRLEVRRAEDGSDETITCDGTRSSTFHWHAGGLLGEGAVVLGRHRKGNDINLATTWQSGSREVLIVYNVSRTRVRQVLSASMNYPASFGVDSAGRERVVVPDEVDVGVGEIHPARATVYTWDGGKFVSRRGDWASLVGHRRLLLQGRPRQAAPALRAHRPTVIGNLAEARSRTSDALHLRSG